MSDINLRVFRIYEEFSSLKTVTCVNLEERIDSLVHDILGADESVNDVDITALFCGKILNKKLSFVDNGIANGSIIHFIIKPKILIRDVQILSPISTSQVLTDLNYILKSGNTAKIIELFLNKKWSEDMLVSNPELGKDVVAYSILQDLKLLTVIIKDRQSIAKLISTHPCLLKALHLAIKTIMESLYTEDSVYSQLLGQDSLLAQHPVLQDYTVDQELEDEDEEELDEAEEQILDVPHESSPQLSNRQSGNSIYRGHSNSRRHRGSRIGTSGSSANLIGGSASSSGRFASSSGARRRRVSRSELQAAIARAQGMLTGVGTPNTSLRDADTNRQASVSPFQANSFGAHTRTHEYEAPQTISPDALSRAIVEDVDQQGSVETLSTSGLHEAEVTPTTLQSPPPQPPELRWREQLIQLQEMGVADTLMAVQALEATNGDISLALNILFN